MEKTPIMCPECMEEFLVKTHGDDDELYCTACECHFTLTGPNSVKYKYPQK